MKSILAIFGRLYKNRTGLALVLLSIALPSALFALAAWQSYAETARQQDARVERTTRILQEHAIKVFETHHLVIEQVDALVKGMDWNDTASMASLHATLKRLQDELDQVATITIVDAQGNLLASSRTYPVNRTASYADRDWFGALAASDKPTFYVSRSYAGRQSKQQVFNVARRLSSQAQHFTGAISVSVDRAYFESFYKTIEPDFTYNVVLLRSDGEILARVPESDTTRIAADATLLARLKTDGPEAYVGRSWIDAKVRITSFRPIASYPVFVIFGLDRDSAFRPWRQTVFFYGIAAATGTVALLLVSALAIRQTHRWKAVTTALRSEAASRQAVEEKLRQAQKMEAVGQLTGGIAHDFNNLLTGILGSLDLLQARITQGRIAETSRYITAAQGAAKRAAALTHRLLAFSRRQALEPRATNVNRLVADLEDLIRRTMGPPVEVETVGAAGLWTVSVDANQLENALLNLCINARDAMPEGGKLTIETANRQLDPRTAAERDLTPGDYVSLCVSDTGTGMPADVIAKAFDPFFTTKPIGAGTGLGLSMTYGFARQSGGQARIYSEVGKGTMVCIYLPRHQGEEAVAPTPAAQETLRAARGEVILVVDDEETVRLLVVDVLRELGYETLEAVDGAGGIAILEGGRRIDLLITDIGLPGTIDGRQVAAAGRRLRPAMKTLFITGYVENAVIGHDILDADMPVLTKPFAVNALARRVKTLLAS